MIIKVLQYVEGPHGITIVLWTNNKNPKALLLNSGMSITKAFIVYQYVILYKQLAYIYLFSTKQESIERECSHEFPFHESSNVKSSVLNSPKKQIDYPRKDDLENVKR